jgi:hypothetical protein
VSVHWVAELGQCEHRVHSGLRQQASFLHTIECVAAAGVNTCTLCMHRTCEGGCECSADFSFEVHWRCLKAGWIAELTLACALDSESLSCRVLSLAACEWRCCFNCTLLCDEVQMSSSLQPPLTRPPSSSVSSIGGSHRFKRLEKIGAGSFGDVFKAYAERGKEMN